MPVARSAVGRSPPHRSRFIRFRAAAAAALVCLLALPLGRSAARAGEPPHTLGSASGPGEAAQPSGRPQAQLQLASAWNLSRGDPAVVVAVVDTGVQADHPALRGRVLPGDDLVDPGASPGDDNGHGTAVAGIVASTCLQCRILPVKVLGANGVGDWAAIALGVRWAADHGAAVIDLSTGASRAPDAVGAAVAYALARGVIVVAAAGNRGSSEPFYPAAYPGVVSVGGVDANDARYSWSDYGSWVTVAAPGCASTTWVGGGYAPAFCGTSAAAPFVAGVAGLARSYRPGLTPDAFRAALAASAAPLADGGTAADGGVDANRLLESLGAPATGD